MSTTYQSKAETAAQASDYTRQVPTKPNGQAKPANKPGSQGDASASAATRVALAATESPQNGSALADPAPDVTAPLSSSQVPSSSAALTANATALTTLVTIPLSPILIAAEAIQALYVAKGSAGGVLGNPLNASTANVLPDGVGYFRPFQFGSIYWSPQTGAHEVHGAIFAKWASMGWERSLLGYPLTDETATPDAVGRYNHFQGGSIYWTPQTGAHEVHGAIRGEWASLGWERGFLGYPLTDETGTPDGIGRYNHFQGGSVYWSPQSGAHEVHGNIRDKWASMGWETSYLGYPVSDEYAAPPGRASNFQNGQISWTSNGGAVDIPQTYIVDAPNIVFGTGISIGGNARLTLQSNGVLHYRGHLHDSGFPSYDYLSVFTVKDTMGNAYGATHTGRTHGTDESGSRDSDWDETSANDLVRQHWQSIMNGNWGWKVDVTSDWSPQKIAEDIASLVGTTVGIIALFV